MNVKKLLAVVSVMAFCIMAFAGCEKKKSKEAVEQWAYPHDTETAVLSFYKDGTATFEKKDYKKYEIANNEIKLFDENGVALQMTYVDQGETRYILKKTVYHFNTTFGTYESGVIGVWESDDHLSFEFTEKGTFLEDGVLPGHYYVDEEKGTIRLVYNEPIDDAVLYYTLQDGDMTVEYPWPMVKATK